jgi:2,3-bisphosphoglycerate-independent phosphoglycerate mutase
MPSKALLLIVDGIGDVSVPALGDRTPLQVADTPFLDALAGGGAAIRQPRATSCSPLTRRQPAPDAAAGVNGLSDPVEPGLACGSDTAHMNIFGYDPRK